MPTSPYNPRRRDEEEDDDVLAPTAADEIEVDFESTPSPQPVRGTGMRPVAMPDGFASGGIPDAPNLQTRRAVTKIQLGQPASQRDYRTIAQRQGIEAQQGQQRLGEGPDAPDLAVRTAALKAQTGAPLSNREIDRLNTRQHIEAQEGNLPPERSVATLLAGSRLDPRGTRAEQAAEARRLAAEEKQAARAAEIKSRREFNSKAMEEYKKVGARYYTDPATGRLTPVVDEKGRQLYYRSDWEPGVDPQGKPAKVMRDEFGQRQFKRPTVVASPDAHDDFLYADMGDGESVPYMKIEEAVVHPDFSLQRTALAARRRRNETMHREALAPVKAMADQAQLEYDSAREQIAQIQGQIEAAMQQSAAIPQAALSETEGGFLGIGAKPTAGAQQAQSQKAAVDARMQQLQAAQMQLEDDLKPGGRLARAKVMGAVGLKLATATAVRDAYRDQEQEIIARLKFQGKQPESDPMFIENRKRLQEADAVIQGAGKERQRYEQLFSGVAPVAAAPVPAAPEEPSTLAEGSKSFARGALSEGFYAAAEGGARMVQNVEAALKEERGGPQAALSALVKERDALSGGQRTLGGAKRGRRTTPEEAERLKQLEQVEIPQARAAVIEDKRRRLEGTVGGWYADQVAQTRDIIRKALPIDQKFAESTLGQIAQGAGQLAGTLPLAFTGAAGPAALATASFGQIYQEGYDDAIAEGADPARAHQAAIQYLPAGALDALSNRTMVGKALKPLVGKATVRQIATDVLKTAAMEGGTEGAQQGYLNAVAKVLEGYDPERQFDEEVLQSIVVGAVLGGGITAASQGAQRVLQKDDGALPPPEDTGTPSTDVPPPPPAPITAADAAPTPTVEEAAARLQAEAANDPELAALLAESESAPTEAAPVAEPATPAPAGTPAPVAEVAPAAVEPVAAPVAVEEPAPAPATAPAPDEFGVAQQRFTQAEADFKAGKIGPGQYADEVSTFRSAEQKAYLAQVRAEREAIEKSGIGPQRPASKPLWQRTTLTPEQAVMSVKVRGKHAETGRKVVRKMPAARAEKMLKSQSEVLERIRKCVGGVLV